MKVVLDTSIVLGAGQSSYRYFSELIPRLRRDSGLSLEVLPSPYFNLPHNWFSESPSYRPIIPGGSWIPQGRFRKALSKIKWAFEKSRQKRAFFDSLDSVFHSFYYTTPPTAQTRLVTVVHDATIEKLDSELGLRALFSDHLIKKEKSISRASRIIAVSEATKKDISHYYGVAPEKIDCIYHAVGSDFFVDPNSSRQIERPYLLQVGGRLHHRNFKNLAEAFCIGGFGKDYLLVSAGEPWSSDELTLFKRLGIESQVQLFENPSVETLRNLYQHAEMLVYPSLYEGFGFPIVEAMACGTPVATSLEAGSIPEIAGKAAHYFDPRNPQDMVQKISELLDPQRKEIYRRLGFENIKRFSWDKTAEQTLSTYRKVFSA